jgi:polyisoprenoid-binding protein YceI
MALTPGTYKIGPDTGSLHLKTTREGMAAKVGHDLLIELQRWTGTVTIVDDDPSTAHVEVEVEMSSFTVLEGTGGVASLSGGDRKDITATAMKLLEVDSYPTATFASDSITGSEGGGTIEGTLTMHGTSGKLTVQVTESGPSTWAGTASLLQSDYGIKPYKAFFGALKLANSVAIEVSVKLGSPQDSAPSSG